MFADTEIVAININEGLRVTVGVEVIKNPDAHKEGIKEAVEVLLLMQGTAAWEAESAAGR